MSFPQRLVNSLLTGAYLLFRRLYILPRTEAMLQEVFPQETIPSLDELGQNIGIVHPGIFQFQCKASYILYLFQLCT